MKAKKYSPLWEWQHRKNKVGICEMCNTETELTVDHIFPVFLLTMWGMQEQGWQDEQNLQLICKACQTLKGSNFDFHNPKTVILIQKYLALIHETYYKNNKLQ